MSIDLVERARRLAEEQLSGLGRRWDHVQAVAAAAERMRPHLDSQAGEFLVAAAWLHDIGYGADARETGFHPVDGARFVRSQGFPEPVVSLVAFHTGAAVEAAVRGIDELAEFTEPAGAVSDALTFCDLTNGPEGMPVSAAARLDEVMARYGSHDPVHRAVSSSRKELLAAVDRVQSWLQDWPRYPRYGVGR